MHVNHDELNADLPASDQTPDFSIDEIPLPDNSNPDARLYIPDHNEWEVHIKRDSDRVYCYAKLPGQDWFHMILNGEIFISRQHERYCLGCALRLNYLTHDRLFWQHRVLKKKPTI